MNRNKTIAKFRYAYLFKEDKEFSNHLSYVNKISFKAALRQRKISSAPFRFFPYNFWDKPSQLWKTSVEYWYHPIFPSKVGLVLLEIGNIISLFRQFRQSFFIFIVLFKKVSIFFCIPFFSFFSKYSTFFPFLDFSQKFAKVLGLLFYFFWKKKCSDRSNIVSSVTHDIAFSKLIESNILLQFNNKCYFEQNRKVSGYYFEDSSGLQNKTFIPKSFKLGKFAVLLFYFVIFSRWFKKNYEFITFKN